MLIICVFESSVKCVIAVLCCVVYVTIDCNAVIQLLTTITHVITVIVINTADKIQQFCVIKFERERTVINDAIETVIITVGNVLHSVFAARV